jgi:hypothetical protein
MSWEKVDEIMWKLPSNYFDVEFKKKVLGWPING